MYIVSLGLPYQVRIMTLASTVFKKSTFQKQILLKCIRKLSRSRSTYDYLKNKLGRPHIADTTRSLTSGSGEDFLRVFTIDGCGSHLVHVTRTI